MSSALRCRIAAAFGLVASVVTPALAQRGGGDGFLFQPPTVSFGLRAGYDRAIASSDLFSFTTEHLTLGRGSFSSLSLAGDVGFRLTQTIDLTLGIAFAGTSAGSEFRDWVDNNDQPIRQTTTFRRVPLTASLKVFLVPRGQQVGSFAWVPSDYAVYVGGGVGLTWYRFRQNGDFIDFNTLRVFSDDFNSAKWTQSVHLMAGTERTMTNHLALAGEARYTWAKGPLENDFSGFHRLDLSGLSVMAGVSLRY